MNKERKFGTRLDLIPSKNDENYFSLNVQNTTFMSLKSQKIAKNYKSTQEEILKKMSSIVEENISDKRFQLSDIPPNLDIRKMDFSTILGKKEKSEKKIKKRKKSHDNFKSDNHQGMSYSMITDDEEAKKMKIRKRTEEKNMKKSGKKRRPDKLRKNLLRRSNRRKNHSSSKKNFSRIPKSFSYVSLKKSSEKNPEKLNRSKESVKNGKREKNLKRRSSKKTAQKRSQKGSRSSLYSKNHVRDEKSPHSMIMNLKAQLQAEKNRYKELKSRYNLQNSENKKLKKISENWQNKEEGLKKKYSDLKGYTKLIEKELESLRSKMGFFEQIQKEIGGQPDLKEFIECNLGINKKLDLKLRKGNENFSRMCKQYEDLKKVNSRLKKQVENLNSKISVYEARERIKSLKDEGKEIMTVKEKLQKERKKARRLRSRSKKGKKKNLKENKKIKEKEICQKCKEREEKNLKQRQNYHSFNRKISSVSVVEFDNLKRKNKDQEKKINEFQNKFILLNNEISRLNIENNTLKNKVRKNNMREKKLKKKNKGSKNQSKIYDTFDQENSIDIDNFDSKMNFNSFSTNEEFLEVERIKENIDYTQLTILYNKLVKKHYNLIKKIKQKKEGKFKKKEVEKEEQILDKEEEPRDEKIEIFASPFKQQNLTYYDSRTSDEEQEYIFTKPEPAIVEQTEIKLA